ncbi:MAG: M23 family metallopeptidase [Gemmatimonadota bacterium]|nr:M23 family metallopeptidase [Gemmatimonadota bacterium]
MFKRSNITLIIIPEKGRKTFEFKIPVASLWLLGLCSVVLLVFLPFGLWSYFDKHELTQKAAQLEQDNALLEEQVGQINQLEKMLVRLKRGNDRLRAILGKPEVLDEEAAQPSDGPPYISFIQRLRWGHVHTVPTLWPLRGPVLRPFSEEHPSVVIAAVAGSLVRASAAGQVMQAGYDKDFGYMVMLDHGNGLLTQYGYNARLFVEVGDYVLKGQSIALLDEGRGARRPGLHYAVQEDGQFRDPLLYRLWM